MISHLPNAPPPIQFASNQGKSQDQRKKKLKKTKKELLLSNATVQKLEFIINSNK